jgi:hypothetical protein
LYSFVVDEHPKFAYQGWHLARSLLRHCGAEPRDIFVQATGPVPERVRQLFAAEGYSVRHLEYFGDRRYCNKLSQIPTILDEDFDRIVLLDTDMIAVADVRPFLSGSAVQAKIVDGPNPSMAALTTIFRRAGHAVPACVRTDTGNAMTVSGNANGGFYAISRHAAARFSEAWRRWAEWLLAHDDMLRGEGKQAHVDQVAAALAINIAGFDFAVAPSNVNYFVHYRADRHYFDPARPIALLHYHDATMNMGGTIEPPIALSPPERACVALANRQIREGFCNALFWDFRYATHPDRGSGLGSRGNNLLYKRALLQSQGLEEFSSVLDVGCGDLQVLGALNLKGYLGLDVSAQAIEKARLVRPDWDFAVFAGQPIDARQAVVCLEVLIHQQDAQAYGTLINFLAEHTERTLFVSGYEHKEDASSLVFFHEPLSRSLAGTRHFRSIEPVGAHTDVVIYRCEV